MDQQIEAEIVARVLKGDRQEYDLRIYRGLEELKDMMLKSK